MSSERRVNRAFTFIELLVVIGILALGAVVLTPQLARASQTKDAEVLASRVEAARAAIDRYKQDHDGRAPDMLTNGWDELIVGGYLPAALENPIIPVAAARSRIIGGFSGSADAGWHWDPNSQTIGASYFNEGSAKIDLTRP
ncbi:MAG: type II secretion system protein [Planctomycetota bacterium]